MFGKLGCTLYTKTMNESVALQYGENVFFTYPMPLKFSVMHNWKLQFTMSADH